MAITIDGLLLLAIVLAYLFTAATIAGLETPSTSMGGLDALAHQLTSWSKILGPASVLALVLGAVYSAVFAILWGGRTPGRRVAGIRLVDGRGTPPAPARALVRAVLSIFSFAFLLAGFWLALFDRRGQTLHDKLTRTFVVEPS